ncbi:SigE family RNA polymerase sigma factor [Sesbania bispinosa]|nr:SigE family RNA polymerase sigma factor [Sesbania bispinosa]
MSRGRGSRGAPPSMLEWCAAVNGPGEGYKHNKKSSHMLSNSIYHTYTILVAALPRYGRSAALLPRIVLSLWSDANRVQNREKEFCSSEPSAPRQPLTAALRNQLPSQTLLTHYITSCSVFPIFPLTVWQ